MRNLLVTLSTTVLLTVDLASAAEVAGKPSQVDVFVSGSEGYHTFRIPALIVTERGTLLAFCEGRKTSRSDHGDVDLVVKRSADGGRTWGSLEMVYEEGGGKKVTIGNPCPVVDRETGVVWLPFTRDNDDVFVTFSNDDGRSWSEPRLITNEVKKEDWTWYATGPGNAIQLDRGPYKGRLLVPCDHRVKSIADRRKSTHSHVIYSDDHGKSWKLGGSTGPMMNECAVVQRSDGSLLLNMRGNRGRGKRGVSVSRDGGLTWSEPVDDATLIEPVCQASLIRYPREDPSSKSRLLFSNPASTSGRHHLTVRLSRDEGKTWPISKLLYAGSAAYSSLAKMPDGKIGIVYERDNYKKITFGSFTLKWLESSGK